MEDKNKDSLPEFDSKYIDQLFSAGRTSPKKEVPPPEIKKPQPAPKEEPTPTLDVSEPVPAPGKRPGIGLLVVAAVVLFGIGFLLGRLTAADPGTTTPHPSESGGPTHSGIATDYASMSTQELVSIATQIEALCYYGSPNVDAILPENVYTQLQQQYPVLVELPNRPDAVTVLYNYMLSAYGNAAYAANALIDHYERYFGFNTHVNATTSSIYEWIVNEDAYTVVYEYTTAPNIYDTATGTTFNFCGVEFTVNGQVDPLEGHAESPNFWFRVELKANAKSILADEPYPHLTHGLKSWADIQPYGNGWIIYGYADKVTEISFSFDPKPHSSQSHYVVFTAFPDYGSTITQLLVSDLNTHLDLLIDLYNNNIQDPDKDLSLYPPFAELLRREDAVTALLHLSMKENSVSHLFYNQAIYDRMTNEEREAMNIISQGSGYFTATVLSEPAIIETPDGNILNGFNGYHVGNTPNNLQNTPLSELNCWIYVPLTVGGRILRQSGWKMEAYSGSTKLGSWILYDSTTNTPVGWIVAGNARNDVNIWLQLKQSSSQLEKMELIPNLLES